MADVQFSAIVTSIAPSQTNTSVRLTSGQDVYGAFLKNDHPAYNSIFTLLMASAVNKKPITLDVITNAVGDSFIQGVEFEF
jgi:hypothetical protein